MATPQQSVLVRRVTERTAVFEVSAMASTPDEWWAGNDTALQLLLESFSRNPSAVLEPDEAQVVERLTSLWLHGGAHPPER